jgi:hypothetical protein
MRARAISGVWRGARPGASTRALVTGVAVEAYSHLDHRSHGFTRARFRKDPNTINCGLASEVVGLLTTQAVHHDSGAVREGVRRDAAPGHSRTLHAGGRGVDRARSDQTRSRLGNQVAHGVSATEENWQQVLRTATPCSPCCIK